MLAAMTDAPGPGSHVLYQDFAATAGGAALSFALFIGNRASLEGGFAGFATPASLDFSTPTLNQQARVDILKNTADPFSVAPADVLANFYQTKAGDPLVSGYNTVTTNITALLAAHVGETLRLRVSTMCASIRSRYRSRRRYCCSVRLWRCSSAGGVEACSRPIVARQSSPYSAP